MKGSIALVFCVAALTAWLVTAGKTNTHSLALQHKVHLGQYITLRVVMIHAFVAEHSLRLLATTCCTGTWCD